jgi:hypothetical protein
VGSGGKVMNLFVLLFPVTPAKTKNLSFGEGKVSIWLGQVSLCLPALIPFMSCRLISQPAGHKLMDKVSAILLRM